MNAPAPEPAGDRIRWIDLSAHGIALHAVRLPSGRVALVVAGDAAAHGPALAALGFRRTRQGHVVHPEPTLKFADARRHFPRATVRWLPRERVARIVPPAPSVAPDAPDPVAAPPGRPPETPAGAGATDHLVHGATLLGVNRRGQQVYEDGAENRYLAGEPDGALGAFGPPAGVDFLRLADDGDLPDLAAGLLHRALREEKLGAEDLLQLGRAIAVPVGRPPVSAHALQEALEAASVRHVRAAWAGLAPAAAFGAARRLAENLPPAVTRSADTLTLAQYSTPLPLAVAARELLGPMGAGRTLLEPTAGHGALLLGLPPDTRITAVEIDPDRAGRLAAVLAAGPGAAAGSRVAVGDILRQPAPEEPYDYILANPPFGDLARHRPETGGRTRVAFEGVSFPTRRLDHLILLETLKRRHPRGRAVYLIGADHPRDHDLATPAGGSRHLFNLLGDHYRVEAVIGLRGRLYGGQGARWPLVAVDTPTSSTAKC